MSSSAVRENMSNNGKQRPSDVDDPEANALAYLEQEASTICKRDLFFKLQMPIVANMEEKHFRLEEERIQTVQDHFNEMHPPDFDSSCPICLDPINTDNLYSGFASCTVCGGLFCTACSRSKKLRRCPLCQAENLDSLTKKQKARYYMSHAERGVPWQQHNMARAYRLGNYGLTKNSRKAAKWFQRAAKQGFRDSQYEVAYMYKNGDLLPKNRETALDLFKKAAAKGHPGAQLEVGLHYRDGNGGLNCDVKEATYWLTLASTCTRDEDYSCWARCELAQVYLDNEEDEGSLFCAKFWLLKSLEYDDAHWTDKNCLFLKGTVQQSLARTYLKIYQKHYKSIAGGPVPYPDMFRLLYQAKENGEKQAQGNLDNIGAHVQSSCCYCDREGTEVELRGCTRCNAAYYCSRVCQKRHHKFHKLNCAGPSQKSTSKKNVKAR